METSPVDSSRSTLAWGGSGIVLATLPLLISQAVFLFPITDISWMSNLEQPLLTGLSGCILVVSFVILAVGLRGEPGIASTSVVGKTALILFGVFTVVTGGYFVLPGLTVDASPAMLAFWSIGIWSIIILRLAALVVASIVTFRAGVLSGAARWGLPVLALTTTLALVADRIPLVLISQGWGTLWLWLLVISQAVQLVTGVLYVVRAATVPRRPGLEPAPEF